VNKKIHTHTVIVGAGFAGVSAALELAKNKTGRVTLVSDEPYFLHHATLYATATGRNRAESVLPLIDIFKDCPNVEIVQDKLVSLDTHRKLAICKKSQYNYDNLVLAIGTVTTYFGVKGMAQHSFGIKTLEQIKKFNKHIHDSVAVDRHIDRNYVVVGAGPTGVELAGALQEYLTSLKASYKIKKAKVRVSIAEAAPRVLPGSSKTASRKVHKHLEKLGVHINTNQRVESIDDEFVTINGKKIPTETVIWTCGVKNNPFFAKHTDVFRIAKNDRVAVDDYLQTHKNIFVVGDNSDVKYSGMAYPAIRTGQFVAKTIHRKHLNKKIRPFRPIKPASATPVGESWAYVEWFRVYVAGRTGYALRRLIELYGYTHILPFKDALSVWRSRELSETDV
jgi:NADH dehydrogenase